MPLYQPMYSTTALRAPARAGHARVSMSSPLSEEKKLSARALSQHWPAPPDRQGDLVLFREGGVGRGSVLGDVIGVEDHARLGAV